MFSVNIAPFTSLAFDSRICKTDAARRSRTVRLNVELEASLFHNISHFPSKTPFLKAAVSLPSPSPLSLSYSRSRVVWSTSPPRTEAIPGTHCSLLFNQNGQRPEKGETFADARCLAFKWKERHCGLRVVAVVKSPHTFDSDHERWQIV